MEMETGMGIGMEMAMEMEMAMAVRDGDGDGDRDRDGDGDGHTCKHQGFGDQTCCTIAKQCLSRQQLGKIEKSWERVEMHVKEVM